uniref:ARAD1D05258p n=1 Tax=Blastobotrys adeninivorans TaxID=409370 RepID=A0A060T8A4_BLAAD
MARLSSSPLASRSRGPAPQIDSSSESDDDDLLEVLGSPVKPRINKQAPNDASESKLTTAPPQNPKFKPNFKPTNNSADDDLSKAVSSLSLGSGDRNNTSSSSQSNNRFDPSKSSKEFPKGPRASGSTKPNSHFHNGPAASPSKLPKGPRTSDPSKPNSHGHKGPATSSTKSPKGPKGMFAQLEQSKKSQAQHHGQPSKPHNHQLHKFGQVSQVKNSLAEAGLRRPPPMHRPNPHSTPSKTTFNSPVRPFNRFNSTLTEAWTPKSMQWSRPADLSLIRKEQRAHATLLNSDDVGTPKIVSPLKDQGFSESETAILVEGRQWGTKTNSFAIRTGSTSVAFSSPSRQGYVSESSSVVEQAQELLETLSDDTSSNENEEPKKKEINGLTVSLLSHQVRGLEFLLKREGAKINGKGGFLCDDMGLGKTVQSIALILSNPMTSDKTKDRDNSKELIKTTLVIGPLSLGMQWKDEIETKAPGLRVMFHHGPKRTKDSSIFKDYDVVVTTYNVIISDQQMLREFVWWRIILDEAHTIKNSQTKMAKAAHTLFGRSKWCLTGTPIQNTVDDLYSLTKFVGIAPYNDPSVWKTKISDPVKKNEVRLALKRLHVYLGAVMLRRTKKILKGTYELPERRVHKVEVEFSEQEMKAYSKFSNEVKGRVMNIRAGINDGESYMQMLLRLLRMRQICDHPALCKQALDPDDKESLISSLPSEETVVEDLMSSLSLSEGKEAVAETGGIDYTGSSSKVRKILDIIKKDPKRKTIIFSQFTSMLDLLEDILDRNDVAHTRYDGSMKADARDRSLDRLKHDPSVPVLLCSLKCGALGLNLTCANRVVLVDPWWNPMVTDQAIDRVHRIGQKAPVDVYEMVVRNSVEERIFDLHEKKRALADGVINGKVRKELRNNLTMEELLNILQ